MLLIVLDWSNCYYLLLGRLLRPLVLANCRVRSLAISLGHSSTASFLLRVAVKSRLVAYTSNALHVLSETKNFVCFEVSIYSINVLCQA